ncbi:NAD(P)-dependent oxidoreductase, partial [Rhizobium ruizarguesonis]
MAPRGAQTFLTRLENLLMPPIAENSGSTVVAAVIGLGSMGLGMALSM